MIPGEDTAQALFERWDFFGNNLPFIDFWFLFFLQGALVKTDEQEVINFLLTTEIIPLCLRIMESGSELSKTVPTLCLKTSCCLSLTDPAASKLQSWLVSCCKCWGNSGWSFYLLKKQTNQTHQTKLEFLSLVILLGKILLLSTPVPSFAALQSNFQG